MKRQDIIEFFDGCAEHWDERTVLDEAVVESILDNAKIGEGQDILDVACGTGVLMPYYINRKVASVLGVDISPEMAKKAEEKFGDDKRIKIVCADVKELSFKRKFDRIMIFNAFPHFPEPEELIRLLSLQLKEGGVLSVAHSESREKIDAHHKGAASKVSLGLMEAEELQSIFARYLSVESVISDDRMYLVSGIKK